MNQDHVTVTLPISEHGLGVVLTVLGVVALSILILFIIRHDKASDWLPKLQARMGLGALPEVLVLLLCIVWAALFLCLLFGIFWVIYGILERAGAATEEAGRELRWYLLTLTAVTASLGAVISLPFTLIRVSLNRRQTETAEEGLRTDRINKAVEGLGAEKTVRQFAYDAEGNRLYYTSDDGSGQKGSPIVLELSSPNIEARLGSILALRSISDGNSRDTSAVLEILSSYVRNNCGRSVSRVSVFQESAKESFAATELSKLHPDVAAALDVVNKIRKDLDDPKLKRIDLRRTNFSGQTLFQRAFRHYNFQVSYFSGSRTYECDFRDCLFNLANFDDAILLRCDFSGAVFSGIRVNEDTSFRDSELECAFLCQCDLSQTNVTQEQLEAAYGNRSVVLPSHLMYPKHWSNRDLSFREAVPRWEAFKKHKGYKSFSDNA